MHSDDHRTFFYRVSELLALLCWSLLYLLRDRRQSWLTREEIRLARFSLPQFGEDLVIEKLINNFLNIDCEGADLEVLQSLDFAIHQPLVVAVEALDIPAERDICAFMRLKGYEMTHRLGLTRLFLPRSDILALGWEAS